MNDDHDTDDDDLLWTAYTKGVKPMGARAPRVTKRPRKVAIIRTEGLDITPLSRKQTIKLPTPITAPDKQTQRKLKRGTWDIAAEIDLHGMTQTQAYSALIRFMQVAITRSHKCVRIITGKGGRMNSTGILRQKVPEWLREPPIGAYIVSLHHPPPHQGGTGAITVILRKLKDESG